MAGHVFIIAGDLTSLACDAWLLPTDAEFKVSASFAGAIGLQANQRLEGLSWDGERIKRLDQMETDLPQVWLADVGRSGQTADWYAQVVEPFARAAKEECHARPDGRPLLLAVNVLGTGEGGMAGDKGDIHAALLPALHRAANDLEVDMVLVCWGRRAYSAAQRIRRQCVTRDHGDHLRGLWDFGDRQEVLEDAARALADVARQRNLVLFLGAGVSASAGLPTWQAMLDGILDKLSPTDQTEGHTALTPKDLRRLDVRDQAELLKRRLGGNDKELRDALHAQISKSRYGLSHGLLASLPIREMVTTNFDQLMEIAVKAANHSEPAVLPYGPVAADQCWILKLHGCIALDERVVLTRSDYLDIPARHSALFGLVQAMLLTRHMLFVGYSLSDEDVHQIIHEVRLARCQETGPTYGTILTLFDDPLFAELWGKDLKVVAVDQQPTEVNDFAVAMAARRLEILLDLIAYLSADLDAFLLDPAYDSMLSPAERKTAEALKKIEEALREIKEESSPAAGRIHRAFQELGHNSPGTRP